MLSYSANKQNGRLVDINKISPQMTATDTQDEFKINARGDWFYFADSANRVLYEAIREINGGTIVKRNDEISIMSAFSEAIALDLTEATIYPLSQATESPISPETQEQIKEIIQETKVLQPLIQPVIVQQGETVIPQFQSFTAEPQFEEIATYAEAWVWQNIAMPVIAKGVKVYNDNIPENEVRPREYVVMSVDDELRDIYFAGNKNQNEESFVTLIIQGFGNTFNNWVVEISYFIQELLRGFREKGKVRDITNRNIGMDSTTNILSRTITFWLQK